MVPSITVLSLLIVFTPSGAWQVDTRTSNHERRNEITDTCDLVSASSLQCLHGGKCAAGHDEWSPTNNGALCDCRSAFEVTANETFLYVGRTCEIRIEYEDYCAGKDSLNRNNFCVNGGTCRVQAVNFDKKPCTCPNGYVGRHCEIDQQFVQPDCPLSCSGHGECEFGLSPFENKGANNYLDLPNQGSFQYAHCICDEGYAGTNCEYEYTNCGDNFNHVCFHGSSCQAEGDGQVCVCEDAVGRLVAGDFCEFEATDSCQDPLPPTESNFVPSLALTEQSGSFCVNNGVCVQINGGGPLYCECDDRHEGQHCEARIVPAAAPTDTMTPTMEQSLSFMPTEMGSVTEVPTLAPASPTMFPSIRPTLAPYTFAPSTDTPTADGTIAPSEVDENQLLNKKDESDGGDDDDKLPRGAKIGISLFVICFVGILAGIFCYFDRRALEVDQATFQQNYGRNEFV